MTDDQMNEIRGRFNSLARIVEHLRADVEVLMRHLGRAPVLCRKPLPKTRGHQVCVLLAGHDGECLIDEQARTFRVPGRFIP